MELSVAVDTERLVLLSSSMSRTPILEIRQAAAVLRQRIAMFMLLPMSWIRHMTRNRSIGSSWKT